MATEGLSGFFIQLIPDSGDSLAGQPALLNERTAIVLIGNLADGVQDSIHLSLTVPAQGAFGFPGQLFTQQVTSTLQRLLLAALRLLRLVHLAKPASHLSLALPLEIGIVSGLGLRWG